MLGNAASKGHSWEEVTPSLWAAPAALIGGGECRSYGRKREYLKKKKTSVRKEI